MINKGKKKPTNKKKGLQTLKSEKEDGEEAL